MSERITIDLEKALRLLVDAGWGMDDDHQCGKISMSGLGGPLTAYTQTLTRSFVQTVVAIDQQKVLGEVSLAADPQLSAAIAKFADDFCAGSWPTPLPVITRWQTYLPPQPPTHASPRPLDLLAAGADFYDAATTLADTELGYAFSDAANLLVSAALS